MALNLTISTILSILLTLCLFLQSEPTNSRPTNSPRHEEPHSGPSNSLPFSRQRSAITFSNNTPTRITTQLTGSKISAKTVCPATIKNVPVNPPNTLIATNTFISGASAVPIEQSNNIRIATLYALLLPNISAIGPHRKDDEPIASKTPAFVMLIISVVVEN